MGMIGREIWLMFLLYPDRRMGKWCSETQAGNGPVIDFEAGVAVIRGGREKEG